MHPVFHCANNLESMLARHLQVPRDVVIKHYYIVKTIVKLSKRTFVCVLWSTINSVPQKQYGSMNEECWTRRLQEWRCRDNRWQIVSAVRFLVVKRVSNRIQLCDHILTEREYFWIILWRALMLLKGNKNQKTIPVTWQLHMFTMSVNSLK